MSATKPASPHLSLLRCDPRRVGLELGIELAGLLPAQHVERFDELANTVDLGAEQAKFDDLFVAEVFGELGIDFIFVDGMLALLEEASIMQRRLFARTEVLAPGIIEQVIDHVLSQPFLLCDGRAYR